jgi:hypothetical protein
MEALAIKWLLWLSRNNKVFTDKKIPCRSFTGARVLSIYGLLYNGWSIDTGGLYMVGKCGEGYFFPIWVAA